MSTQRIAPEAVVWTFIKGYFCQGDAKTLEALAHPRLHFTLELTRELMEQQSALSSFDRDYMIGTEEYVGTRMTVETKTYLDVFWVLGHQIVDKESTFIPIPTLKALEVAFRQYLFEQHINYRRFRKSWCEVCGTLTQPAWQFCQKCRARLHN